MKQRFQLPLFALIFFAVTGAHGQSIFTWSPNPADGSLSNASNWLGGSLPSSNGDAQLEFGSSTQRVIDIDLSFVQIHSLTFTGNYDSYRFDSHVGGYLAIGEGGASIPASGNATVESGSNLIIALAGNQTWDIGGHLTVHGTIDDVTTFTSTLTKSGDGTLRLTGSNFFSGGLDVQTGTVEIANSSDHEGGFIWVSPVGLGQLTLADHTTLRSTSDNLQLHNNIALGNNVTFDSGDFESFELAGTITADNDNTTIKVAGEEPILFTSIIDGSPDTHLTFTSTPGHFGGAAFDDVFSDNIKTVTANRAALLFFAVPESVNLSATNNGYIGAAIAPQRLNLPPPSPAALLSRVADPSSFAGTFGFDTHPDAELIHNFEDALNFSAFTHAAFRIGSHFDAILSGEITPVDLGTKSLYPFGGGSGHLVVSSNLTDVDGKPASVLVSTPAGASPQYVVFRGNNTTTGTYTLDGVAAHLAVENSIAVLDSAGALPGGASGKFAFGSASPAYIGATEAAFADFNAFLSHLAPGGHNALSILGLDSHDAFNAVLAYGAGSDDYDPRLVSQEIDLRTFDSIYLGTASDVILAGTLHAPNNGVLKLTAVDDGLLAIAAPFASNVSSVEIGITAGNAAPEFGDGKIEMLAAQTYSGGTTLRSGTLSVANSSSFDHDTSTLLEGPIGTGTLTVESGNSPAILAASDYQVALHNNIVLNAPLQLGSINYQGHGDYAYPDYNRLALYGNVTGSGSLRIVGSVELHGNNTYAGGTVLSGSVYLGSSTALGTGDIRIENFSESSTSITGFGDLTLSNPIALQGYLNASTYEGTFTFAGPLTLEGPSTLSFYGDAAQITGNISGAHALALQNDTDSPLQLSGENTYTGGTQVYSGAVIFTSAVPEHGLITAMSDGYVGTTVGTNIQSSFLNRFDKPAIAGSLGFDSLDLQNPIVVSEAIDLSGFHSSARLGTATAATISGIITPSTQSGPYAFGGGGGTLTVTSNLGSSRSIDVSSSLFAPFAPLTLVLQGDNTSASGLSAYASFVRFDGADALPSTGSLYASDYGYIGYTENVTSLTPATFMARWTAVGSNAIVGFDSKNTASARTITDPISFASSNFNASTYIGTSTRVKLAGSLTPFDQTLRLTGVSTGNLEVDSAITSSQVTNVVIGTPFSQISGNATVTLNSANSYTGGTDLLSSHLVLGHASALGTGTLRVASEDSRLSVNPSAANADVTNAIDTGDFYHELTLDGENAFTLSGQISGQGSLVKTGSSTVTLAGDNSELSGQVGIEKGTLVFAGNHSAGTGGLSFWTALGIAQFLGDAPEIGPISSFYAGNQIQLANNSALTVNLAESFDVDAAAFSTSAISESSSSTIFYGSIHGTGASVTYDTAPETQSSIYLYGASTYTGGTTIKAGVTVVANHANALSTSGTINVNGGTLSTGSGVTLASTSTRPIVFTAGSIAGSGTISFDSSLIVTDHIALTPGHSVGKLTLQFESTAALVLNSGGTYHWELADATGSAGTGWDLIHVAGTVDIAALASETDTFNITLHTIGEFGGAGYAANFNPYAPASWAILTATSITHFDPAKFNLFADSSTFLNDTAGGTFSLSLENNTLLLNFTPVPEPSTWALMITGLAVVAFTALRRRRRA